LPKIRQIAFNDASMKKVCLLHGLAPVMWALSRLDRFLIGAMRKILNTDAPQRF
jgi:hypothetical protein